ncbi:unnamed protein product [Cuscuta epithymum]|uniref:Ubiquitin-like protease family profile domain-containing protein n=1 Tax=Cuscuta epithymum TaxID=186058 RepID=A0AAV0D2S2_9ASTE|nr:unnamed protein product [Cuscuta epithymum]
MTDNTPPVPQSSSVHSFDPNPFANTTRGELPCELLILDAQKVAKATLCKHQTGELVHGAPLLKDHFKVKILHVYDGEESTPLPVPFFGHDFLGDVEGSWAQWPQKQVLLSKEHFTESRQKKRTQIGKKSVDVGSVIQPLSHEEGDENIPCFKISAATLETLPPSYKKLYEMLQFQNRGFCFDVELGKDLFSCPGNQNLKTYITADDIEQFFNMGWLHTSIIQIWIRFLHSYSKLDKIKGEIGFLCPSKLAMINTHPSNLAGYLTHSLSQSSMKKYIFAPLHQCHQWILVVIIIEKGEAFIFNSLGVGLMGLGFEDLQIKGHISLAYRTLNLKKGSRSCLKWSEVKSPQQSHKDESGYYVMRYMYDISLGLLGKKPTQKVLHVFTSSFC